ncbi:hypothetical protein DFH09DRAFT_1349195 [Mycena vulgaris]|nr:hypothetical protein DFH09DRAFT_1349195 [Mycena vulgaris]
MSKDIRGGCQRIQVRRWEKIPDAASTIPGVWANLLIFFVGPHTCIGFRFSLVEIHGWTAIFYMGAKFPPTARTCTSNN